jgi:hypothetical protein
MLRRRAVARRVVRTAAVGGLAYAAGHHVAKKSAGQQYMDEQQNAQIADLQQQAAPPMYYQQPAPPPPAYQQPAPPATPTGLTNEGFAQLKQLGALHESGVLTDAEFEAAKQKILGI